MNTNKDQMGMLGCCLVVHHLKKHTQEESIPIKNENMFFLTTASEVLFLWSKAV